jgi:protein gp37
MGENSNISWTDNSFNGWWGCTKVGPGCDSCYAEAMDHRVGGDHWGVGKPRRYFNRKHWTMPLVWDKAARVAGVKTKVFLNSMSDTFDNEVDQALRDQIWLMVAATPNLIWQVLTKRIGNAPKMLPKDWGEGYSNVWLMATTVNQDEYDRDWPKLREIPARVRGLSVEPMLGPLDLGTEDVRGLHWVICGGESKQPGHTPRRMLPDWARLLRDQCRQGRIAFHVKQMTGREKIPDDLMVREFPGS